MPILQWKDYPKPRLRMNQGKWVVDVSYPASIRHMFGTGKGRSKKLTTGTTDKAQADKREMEIAHKIYRYLMLNNLNMPSVMKFKQTMWLQI